MSKMRLIEFSKADNLIKRAYIMAYVLVHIGTYEYRTHYYLTFNCGAALSLVL